MSKNSPQQNLYVFMDWKNALERKRKISNKNKPNPKKINLKYHPSLEYNEDDE